ncbi:MAG: ABC transporter ATP-binding protein [Clostridia bacterium]|nr:ABC transporter ATP-binding protein [Clostridia bacterium]
MRTSASVKWLWQKSKKQRVKMLVLILANAFFSMLSIAFAFLMKEIIDSASEYHDLNRLIAFSIGIAGVVILQFVFRILINGLSAHITARLEMDYKTGLFKSILGKKHEKITTYHSGELLNRLTSDVTIVADGVASIIPTVVSAFARLICAVVALVILDWIFAVAFTVAGLMVFLTISLLRGKLKSLHKRTQETDGKVRSFMQECIENLLAVKVFSVNDRIEKQATDLQERNFKIKMQRRNYSVVGHAVYNFIFSAGYLFALIYGGIKILNDPLFTYGALSAILQLVNNVQVPFASLSNVLPKYYSMIASTERLIEIENIEDEQHGDLLDRDGVYAKMKGIVADQVDFTYDRDKILKDASVYINKGDFVAITGTSGVGKSTLIKLMLGVYPTDSGSVYIDTEDGKVLLDSTTRSLFSYVPQGNMLFSGTLKDNVTFIRADASEDEINFALKVSCADEFISALPNGLDTEVGENGVGLSEGQVQRIAIARAILTKAPVILLDEATSALDEMTEAKVLDNLKALEDVTLIIVSHKKAALGICNRRIRIENKKIKE